MPLDWSIGELAAGLNCYKREEFFDAHEHWENIWRQSRGPEKPFLQALIQVAGAFHHYRRRNLRGCQALLRGALRRLQPYPERFGGVLLAPLREELAAWLLALEEALTPESSLGVRQEPGATGAADVELFAPGSADKTGAGPGAPMPFPESYPKIHLEHTELILDDSAHGDSQE